MSSNVQNGSATPIAGASRRHLVTLTILIGMAVIALLVYLRWPDQEYPEEPPASVKASPRGWQIRYNANLGLAVKASKHVRLDLLQEMLDENKQLKNFRLKLQDGRDVPDETGARKTVINTLHAIAQWHEKLNVKKALGPHNKDLLRLYALIDDLAENSPNVVVKQEAEKTSQACRR